MSTPPLQDMCWLFAWKLECNSYKKFHNACLRQCYLHPWELYKGAMDSLNWFDLIVWLDGFEKILPTKLQILLSLAGTEGKMDVSNPYKIPCTGGSYGISGRIHTPAIPGRPDLPNPASP